MPRRKTNAEFQQEIYNFVGDEYIFLDYYHGSNVKIRVKHNKCGNIYEVTPDNFLRGSRCPYCKNKAKRKTNAQFKQEVFDLVGDEYAFLDTYVNQRIKIRVKHNKCNNIYEVTPAHFLQGSRCPYCSKNANKNDVKFKKEVFDLVSDEYVFLDTYVNARTKLRVKHNTCGNVYKVAPHEFLKGYHCPYCSSKAKKTDAEFKKEVFDLVGNEYIFLDNYVDAKTKLKVKHNKCGSIYGVTPNAFINGNRCPYCNSSKGELIISKILNKLSIPYEPQKIFEGLRDTQPLSYDFYVPSQSILIEYQGIQHYEPVDHFGGRERFNLQQKHDKIKADYAKNHGYNLITVPYTEDTLSKIKKYLLSRGLSRC